MIQIFFSTPSHIQFLSTLHLPSIHIQEKFEKVNKIYTALKVSEYGVFLVRISLYFDIGKYGPEKNSAFGDFSRSFKNGV